MNEPLAIVREQVARHCGVGVSDLVRPGRGQRRVSHARQLGYHVSRETTAASLPQIARAYGRADHTTVLEGIRAIERQRVRGAFRADLESLTRLCRTLIDGAA